MKKSWEIVAEEYSLSLPEGHFKAGFGKRNETIIPQILKWSNEPDEIREIAFAKESAYRHLIKEQGIEALPGVRDFSELVEFRKCALCDCIFNTQG